MAATLGVLALLVVISIPVGTGGIRAGFTVPTSVGAPLPFTRTVQDAPTGPAALLLSGTGAFSGSDVYGYEGRSAVVGRDGTSRIVRTINDTNVGQNLLLSPDGRYVAGDFSLEGATPVSDEQLTGTTALLDLSTGEVRSFTGGAPIAWSPDGQRLLTLSTEQPGQSWRLALVDIRTGASNDLFSLGGWPEPASFAFSPDGTRLAWQAAHALTVVNLATGQQTPLLDSTMDERRLAGPGAWTPDDRIAVWRSAPLSSRRDPSALTLDFLDPATGATVAGPAFEPVPALAVWLLGWQADGDAVVEVFHGHQIAPGAAVDFAETVQLFAYHPNPGSAPTRTELVGLPADANRVEVARDLMVADKFGGPSVSWAGRVADVANTHRPALAILLALGALGLAGVAWWPRLRPRRRILARREEIL